MESLGDHTVQAAEIIVVDNASTDNSAAVVAAHSGAKWIRLGRNQGFAHAVNTGIQASSGGSVAILNNDVTLAPDCLSILNGTLDRYWFATPKIVQTADPTRIDGTFDLTSRAFCSWRAGNGSPASLPVWNRGTEISSAPMTAALFRRSLFDRVGLLDERFGSYLEDVDFGLRCAQHGLTGWYEPAALASHEGSATLGAWRPATVRLIARNQVVLARKYGYAGGRWPVFAGQAAWGLLAFKNRAGLAWIQGKIEGCRAELASPSEMKLDPSAISTTLRAQERSMRHLLAETGISEQYWNLYFKLCGWAD